MRTIEGSTAGYMEMEITLGIRLKRASKEVY